jgi:hypothetical protein
MKALKLAILPLACVIAATSAIAQGNIYSINIVGYINLSLSPGDNLIANQLDDGLGNSISDVFSPPGSVSTVLTGSTFTEWDSALNAFKPLSVFDGASWTINYTLAPNGIGGVFNSPAAQTVTTIGSVVNFNVTSISGYTFTPPVRGPGRYLLSLAAPVSGATFSDVIGRNPLAGDSVELLNAPTQTYTITTFDGSSWSNGDPILTQVDESAFYDLQVPPMVPEPSTLALGGLGAAAALTFRRARAFRRA